MATFPTLTQDEIKNSLSDLGCPSPADFDVDRPLQKPCLVVYAWFWENSTGIAWSSVTEGIDAYAQGVLDQGNSELQMYGEGLGLGLQYEVLRQMMGWARMEDFAYRDLRDPTATRVRKIMSALINFTLFAREQDEFVQSVEDRFTDELAQKDRTAAELDEMRLKLDEAKVRREQEAEEVKLLSTANNDRRRKLVELKAAEEPGYDRMEGAKRRRTTLQDRLENVTMAIKQHDAEIVRFRSRIVQSPDRVRQTINDMASSLSSLRDEIFDIDKKAREHESRIDISRRYEVDLTSVVKSLEEWMAELTKLHALSGKLHELQEEATKVDETFNEVALQHQQLERRSVVLQESLERHDAASHEKIAGLRTRTAKQQEQYEQLMAEREGFQAKQELKLKDCRKVTEAIEELTRQWNSELDVADAAFRELENDILSYSARMTKALDSLDKAIAQPYASS